MTNKNITERIGIVETKVENLNEKVDALKNDVVGSKNEIKEHLDCMAQSAKDAHDVLTEKICELEKIKDKWFWFFTGAVAVISWVIGHFNLLAKILG
jgi:outer membrane murein-binding lipoprotein Lpp